RRAPDARPGRRRPPGDARGGRDRTPRRGPFGTGDLDRPEGGRLMLRSVPLVYRMQRFEIVAVGVIRAAVILLALLVAREVESVGYGPCYLADTAPRSCEALGRRFFDIESAHATPLFSFLNLLPYA